MERRRLLIGIAAAEALVLLVFAAHGWLTFRREQERVQRESALVAGAVADQLRDHVRSAEGPVSFGEIQRFVGAASRQALWLNDTSEEWRVLEPGQASAGAAGGNLVIDRRIVDPATGLDIVLRVEHDRWDIARNSVLDPSWILIQVTLFALLSIQVVVTAVQLSRRNRVVFEKGYLKEHAIGALKLHHRLLEQIIRDHEAADEAPPEDVRVAPGGSVAGASGGAAGAAARAKVIPLRPGTDDGRPAR